jgi:hypothetical protein
MSKYLQQNKIGKVKGILFFLAIALYLSFSINIAEASNATISYRSNTGTSTTSSPKIREWNSSGIGTWGSEVELSSAGSPVRWAVTKYSPVNSKRIVVTLSDDGYLDAYICRKNCSSSNSWVVSNDIGSVWTTAADNRRFDVEFETATGDAIVVYGVNNTNGANDLAYKILPERLNSFSGLSELFINDAGHAGDIQYTWVSMDRDPVSTSEEIVMVGFDETDSDINALVWNGTDWGNFQQITGGAGATSTFEIQAVRYAADGSLAMCLGGDGTTGNIAAFQWGGTSWTDTADFDLRGGDNGDAQWITLKADPATDDLQAVISATTTQLSTAYWNGATWAVTSSIDTGLDSTATRLADFAWNTSGSSGKLVWDTDAGGSTLSYRTCSPQCTGATNTVSPYAQTGACKTAKHF